MNDELDTLKARADLMGIKYKANIGIESLKAKIQVRLDSEDGDEEDEPVKKTASQTLSGKALEQHIRDTQMGEQLRLVRVRISCLNPAKAGLQGEILTVANRYIGTVRKYVPYGEATDNGYHVPFVLLEELRSRKFNSIKTKKGSMGNIEVSQRLVPEFAIEELPALTGAELAKLAAAQLAASGA